DPVPCRREAPFDKSAGTLYIRHARVEISQPRHTARNGSDMILDRETSFGARCKLRLLSRGAINCDDEVGCLIDKVRGRLVRARSLDEPIKRGTLLLRNRERARHVPNA